MDSKGAKATIDEALRMLAAGTMADSEAVASYSRAAWSGYSLRHDSPSEVISAYWRILAAMPKVGAAIARTVSAAEMAAAQALPAGTLSGYATRAAHSHDEE